MRSISSNYAIFHQITFEERPRRWGWLLALGILMLVAGTFGLAAAVLLTLIGVLAIGYALVVLGVLQLLHSFSVREPRWIGWIGGIALAIFYVAMGCLIIWDPLAASFGLTLVISALFAAIGIIRLLESWQRRSRGWRWLGLLAAGTVDLVIAALIVVRWPISGLWVIGTLIAFELLLNGWLMVLTALASRRAQAPATKSPGNPAS